MESSYLKTHKDGILQERIETALSILESCHLCPRRCEVNRLEDEKGVCKTGRQAVVSSYSPHFGEEVPLVGRGGSGTIFMTHCNLGCIFCQNYEISHQREGMTVEPEQLAEMMVHLAERGCHNINFVTPSHVVPQILEALAHAVEMGLKVPLVYNSGGYEKIETLKMLGGIFDIYMPDFKYASNEAAEHYSNAPDYPEKVKLAFKEMQRQVGDLTLDERGIAQRGLLVRHLVLPDGLAGTKETMSFLAQKISKNIYVNILAQYYPCGEVGPNSPLNRRITQREYFEAVEAAKKEGITRLD